MAPDAVVRALLHLPYYDQIIREFDAWTHISITNGKPRRQALIIDKLGTRPFA
jgi:hypothetical protein